MIDNQDLDFCTKRIIELKDNLGRNIYDIGLYLNQVKENKLYLIKYRFFDEYLEKEVKFSRSSAFNFLKITQEFSE